MSAVGTSGQCVPIVGNPLHVFICLFIGKQVDMQLSIIIRTIINRFVYCFCTKNHYFDRATINFFTVLRLAKYIPKCRTCPYRSLGSRKTGYFQKWPTPDDDDDDDGYILSL